MSTLKVDSIVDGGGSGAPTAPNGLTVGTTAIPTSGALSNRNLIINGAMQVAQRGASGTSAGIGTEDYLSVDRWAVNADGGGSQLSVDVSTDAPDGFSKSLYISPDASVPTLTGGHRIILKHKIEGQDLAQWSYATAECKPLTLSFWVKSNVTGNVGIILGATEICGQTYSINTSGAWEYKTVTFPASVVGSLISYDNTAGLSLDMWLAAGPAFQGTYAGDGVWTTAANTSYTQASNINLYSNTANDFYITGVQLEVGDTATPFEHRSYGDELAKCQRYYFLLASGTDQTIPTGSYYSSTLIASTVQFPVTMRTTPSLVQTTGAGYYGIYANSTLDTFDSFTSTGRAQPNGVSLDSNGVGASGTAGDSGPMKTNNASAYVAFDAEL